MAAKVLTGRWSGRDETAFAEALAECCNVTQAARRVGRTAASAYQRRKRSKAFADKWDDAIAEGFRRLEERLLDRVANGSALSAKGKPASDALALGLLRQHQERARRVRDAQGVASTKVAEVRAAILARIAAAAAGRVTGR